MSSINPSLLAAQSTTNPIRRSGDAAAFRNSVNAASQAAPRPQFRGGPQSTALEATALSKTTAASPASTNAVSVATQPQRPLRPGSIINILV